MSLHVRSFAQWVRKCVTVSSALKYRQYSIYDRLHLLATIITHYSSHIILDTLLTVMFRMWLGECIICYNFNDGPFFQNGESSIRVNIYRLFAGYLNLSINTITSNPEPVIRANGLSQTRKNPHGEDYWSGFCIL